MKLVDLLNKMQNMELVKVEVYVFGATFERTGSVDYWKKWDSRLITAEVKNVRADTKDECICVTLNGNLI
jgi:hypothetical protein